jgi:hypothetical protein
MVRARWCLASLSLFLVPVLIKQNPILSIPDTSPTPLLISGTEIPLEGGDLPHNAFDIGFGHDMTSFHRRGPMNNSTLFSVYKTASGGIPRDTPKDMFSEDMKLIWRISLERVNRPFFWSMRVRSW